MRGEDWEGRGGGAPHLLGLHVEGREDVADVLPVLTRQAAERRGRVACLPSPPLPSAAAAHAFTWPHLHEHRLGAVDDDKLDRAEEVRVCAAAAPAPCSSGALVLLLVVAPTPSAYEAAQGQRRRDENVRRVEVRVEAHGAPGDADACSGGNKE